MRKWHKAVVWAAAPAFLITGCAPDAGVESMASGDVLMGMAITTTSDEARNHFLTGMDAADLAMQVEARDEFAAAVAADSTFAIGYLALANWATSLSEFTTNLEKAEALAGNASAAEQLMISAVRKGFSGDAEGQLADYTQLTQLEPGSSRAFMLLGNAQTGLTRIDEARASYGKAIELEPSMVGAHIALANTFIYNEPKDFTMAETHARHAVDLRPDEPTPYDILGDAHRAQGNLEAAKADYTMAAERAPNDASPVQQRGHVNSFLGDFAAARADYDRAMELGRANEKPSFGMYRAFVSIHEGNASAALDELAALTASVDGMGVPEPTGVKITLTGNAIQIALHNGMTERAGDLVTQLRELVNTQNAQANNDNFSRSNNAYVAFVEGRIAVAMKDFATARAKAAEIRTLVEPIANPRKLEPMHQLLGEVELADMKPADAVGHLRAADQTDTYVRYELARALEGAGQMDEAKAIYTEVANNNFNSVAFALVRADAKAKAGM